MSGNRSLTRAALLVRASSFVCHPAESGQSRSQSAP